MEKSVIYHNKKLKFKDPILIVGLPGIGNVGSLVGQHLKSELKAKKFATLYSPHFPHQVIMLPSGKIRIVNNRFYHVPMSKGKKLKNDIIILVGDFQAMTSEGQYEINDKIVRFFKKLGGKTIYTIGGYNTSKNYIQNPKVFGVATNQKVINKLKTKGIIFGQAAGMIFGSAGLIVAFAKKHGMDAACIMGETGFLDIDANSAKAVLEVLTKLLDIEVNLDDIDNIRKETNKMLKTLEEASKNPEMAGGAKENFTYIR